MNDLQPNMNLRNLFIIFLTLPALFTGCGLRETPVEKGNKTQTLLVGNGAEPEGLDPQITTSVSAMKVQQALFEGLTTVNPKTLAPEPGTAKSWDISQDGRTYTFYLRENAKWSDGTPVTAEDFVFSYKRILTPDLGAQYASMLYFLDNAEAFNTGKIRDFTQVGVKAVDPHTLELRLANPCSYFLSLIGTPYWAAVPEHAIKKHGEVDQYANLWTRPENIVCNGPFILKKWIVGDCISVVKNPHYWDADNVRLNEIRFFPVGDKNTEEHMFRAGQLHISDSFPADKIDMYLAKKSPYLQISPYLGTEFYWFNTTKAPFNDARVRKALSLSIDRKALVTQVSKHGRVAAYSYVPFDTNGYTSTHFAEEDIELAKKLLAEAGYPNGEGFPKVELLYNTSNERQRMAEAVQQMWKKNLGIEITLVNQEWKVFLENRRQRNFQIGRGGWIGDYVDPMAFLEIFDSASTNNHSGWKSAEYDQLIEESLKTLDPEKRLELLQKAEAIALDEMPGIPIFYWNVARLIQTNVQGFYPNLLDVHPYQYIYLK